MKLRYKKFEFEVDPGDPVRFPSAVLETRVSFCSTGPWAR